MLEKIPLHSKIFVDSNIFIYHFLDISDSSTNFLQRIEMRQIDAYTSTVVLAEVLHRLMIAELIEKYKIKSNNAIKFLKEKPEIIATLEKCEIAVKEIPEFNVRILSVTVESIFQSYDFRKKYNLLTNDSLNLNVMYVNGLKHIATNDSDFDGVEWIKVWKP